MGTSVGGSEQASGGLGMSLLDWVRMGWLDGPRGSLLDWVRRGWLDGRKRGVLGGGRLPTWSREPANSVEGDRQVNRGGLPLASAMIDDIGLLAAGFFFTLVFGFVVVEYCVGLILR